MRVLLLTVRMSGPPTSLAATLLRHLPRRGVVPIVAAAQDGPHVEIARSMGVRVVRHPEMTDVRTLRGMLRLVPTVWRLAALARREGIEVIHSLQGSTAPAAILLSRLTGIPHVCHLQFLYASAAKYRKLGLHRATRVVAVADAVRDAFVAACPVGPVPRVIRYGIDADAFVAMGAADDVRRRHGIEDDEVVLLMVGSMDARKDPQTLLRAAASLGPERARLRLLLVGPFRDDDYERSTRSLVQALGVERRCLLVGRQENPSPYFRAADVVVLPTRGDAFGMVLLEAMAHAKPIVASRVGGVPEAVEDGATGLLRDPGDVEGFADAIHALARDGDRRRQFGLRGRRRVEREFSSERAAQQVLDVYAESRRAHEPGADRSVRRRRTTAER